MQKNSASTLVKGLLEYMILVKQLLSWMLSLMFQFARQVVFEKKVVSSLMIKYIQLQVVCLDMFYKNCLPMLHGAERVGLFVFEVFFQRECKSYSLPVVSFPHYHRHSWILCSDCE